MKFFKSAKDLYNESNDSYKMSRRPEPKIQAIVDSSLSDCIDILNVGAGTGSYEPKNKRVIGLDISIGMINRRDTQNGPSVLGQAEHLPFSSSSFDACLALLTIHHWKDWNKGVSELLRVSKRRALILTWDPDIDHFWLVNDYFPELLAVDKQKFPRLNDIRAIVPSMEVKIVPIPSKCEDGFLGAYWQRPEAYLDDIKRKSISSFSGLKNVNVGLTNLQHDLNNGEWERKYGNLRNLNELDIGYRILIVDSSEPNGI